MQHPKERWLDDGSLELTFPVARYHEILMEILRHGPEVQVIRPKRLRTLVKETAELIAKLY